VSDTVMHAKISTSRRPRRLAAHHDQGYQASQDIPEPGGLRRLSGSSGNSAAGNEDSVLCVGFVAESCPFSFSHRNSAVSSTDEEASYRVCDEL